MGRMHNPGKGISRSALPYRRSVPSWLKMTSADVEEHIVKLARKGLRPSQIGVILRDSHGVAQVRRVTGNKIVRILKSKVCFLLLKVFKKTAIWSFFGENFLLQNDSLGMFLCEKSKPLKTPSSP